MSNLALPEPVTSNEPFVSADVNGTPIRFRKKDGFGSLNDVCAAHGKKSWAFLQTAFAKDYAIKLAKKLNQNTAELCSTHTNGLYRGTWLHPIFLVEAARWCDVEFGIACNMMVLSMASEKGRRLPNGDVELRLDAQTITDALPIPKLASFSSETIQALLERVATLEADAVRLRERTEAHRGHFKTWLQAQVQRAESSVLALEAAAPAFSTNAIVQYPNTYDAGWPSADRMRTLVRERALAHAKARGIGYVGVVFNLLYERLFELTGLKVIKPKGKTKIAYVEDNGLLPTLFELSAGLVG